MVLDLTFLQPNNKVGHIRVEANRELTFFAINNGIMQYTTIEHLKINPAGIVKEFPDLEGKPIPEIKAEGIRRLKEHVKALSSLKAIQDYLREDLEKKHGWKLLMIRRKGFRDEKVPP
jgi:hypothetical protein